MPHLHPDIRAMMPADVPTILSIANEQLGESYLSSSLLQSYLNSTKSIALTAVVGHQVVGFSLMEL